MPMERVRLGAGGRVVIPAAYREALALSEGDDLVLMLEDGSLRLLRMEQAVRQAQELVGRYIPPDRDLTSELLQERRREERDG